MTSLSRISFSDQSSVHFGFLYCTVYLRKESAFTRVARIAYHSFNSFVLSGRMSSVLETVGRRTGLFYCTRGLEESKKLREE